MKRYYSHYTYIYPDTYLKDQIVELDDANNIVRVFPYEKEIEKTEFHTGILFFVPNSMRVSPNLIHFTKKKALETFGEDYESNKDIVVSAIICNVED